MRGRKDARPFPSIGRSHSSDKAISFDGEAQLIQFLQDELRETEHHRYRHHNCRNNNNKHDSSNDADGDKVKRVADDRDGDDEAFDMIEGFTIYSGSLPAHLETSHPRVEEEDDVTQRLLSIILMNRILTTALLT